MSIEEYTDEQLLFELAKREFNETGNFPDAPVKTERSGVHYEILIGVGNDHTAHIGFDRDTWLELRKRNSAIPGFTR